MIVMDLGVIPSESMTKKKPPVVDEDMARAALVEYFARVKDPRVERSQLHPLESVLVLPLCAVICGANSFMAIEHFGTVREEWLKTFLDLPNGIPSHDTLGRIFAMLDPKALEQAFREWVATIATLTKGEVVAIDGKTLRRSFGASSAHRLSRHHRRHGPGQSHQNQSRSKIHVASRPT